MTTRRLGTAYALLPSVERAANYRKAVECYEAALTVLTEEIDAKHWALAHLFLGLIDPEPPDADADEKAIEHLRNALRVYTEEYEPADFALARAHLAEAVRGFEPDAGDPRYQSMRELCAYVAEKLGEQAH